jgi:D-alanine-D-alanine ligase
MAVSTSLPSAAEFGKVAVFFGGDSAERDISLMSGQAVLTALQEAGIDAHGFDPARQDIWQLPHFGFERAFIALHGRGGEDGRLQGALDLMRLPYTGSGVMACALSMDKWRTKLVWQAMGLPTPKSTLINPDSDFDAIMADLGPAVFVKPVHEGSSMGAARADSAKALEAAFKAAARYDPNVIAETFIGGRELTVPFLGERILPIVEIIAPKGQYDYQNKYFSDETRYVCPARLPLGLDAEIQVLVRRCIEALGCRGWGRVDILLDEHQGPFLLEMNTAPGMTGHSLVPMSAKVAGIGFTALCLSILAEARFGQ